MSSRWWYRPGIAVLAALGIVLGGSGVSGAAPPAGGSQAQLVAARAAAKGKPIEIGAVIDETGFMTPFDRPALEAAQIEAQRINKSGGVLGRPIEFKVYNDQLQPTLTRSDALKAIAAGAKILWVTCDVTYATPAIEVGLAHHMLVVSPCTGTNELGPARFGKPGRLAFSFGNAPQAEAAVLARLFKQKGWKTATVVTDKLLTYFVDVCKSFTADFQKQGGKIVTQLTFTTGDHTVTQVAQKAANSGAAGLALCANDASPTLPAFVTAVRTLGNTKPIAGPWSLDGDFWEPSSPTISNNIWWDTYASVFGDDPSSAVRAMYAALKAKGEAPATGGFVSGPSALQGIVAAIKKTKGSLVGPKLATAIQHFKNVPTLSGPVSFSAKWHVQISRPLRIIEVRNGKPHYVETLSPGKLAAAGT
jgi:branched-chain amino acid transport system substrate-binding protein